MKQQGNRGIPTALRHRVWNEYIGLNNPIAKCRAGCGADINWQNYVCGHIQARSKGGETKLGNLRPICAKCNNSMGARNMRDFMVECGLPSDLLNVRAREDDVLKNGDGSENIVHGGYANCCIIV
jgi:hypothetical protein